MKEHITVLGALYIAFNATGVVTGLFVLFLVGVGGLLSRELEAIAITSTVAVSISFLIFLFTVPGVIGGIGLLKRASWSRILVLILGCLNLVNMPFGTILGAYTIWVLSKEETIQLLNPKPDPASAPPTRQ